MIRHKKAKIFFIVFSIFLCYQLYNSVFTQNSQGTVTPESLAAPSSLPVLLLNVSVNSSPEEVLSRLAGVNVATIPPEEIVKSINYLNDHHKIQNLDKFGDIVSVEPVIVIQVHNRHEYLKLLIDSLANVPEIANTLLVFSHDAFVDSINDLVQNITFARVIQIYFPYTNQIFSSRFPGTDPRDCEEKIGVTTAKQSGCLNAAWPDSYGNYRRTELAQIKHHWWWKMNYVVDGIMAKYNLSSHILLLEEDHIVMPDVLHTLKKVVELRDAKCPECRMICLGFMLKVYTSMVNNMRKVGKQTWYGKHNTGMVIDMDLWNVFRSHAGDFCENIDDYNWDWSLIRISYHILPQKLVALYTKAPRVLHIGDCGVHAHRCSSQTTYNRVMTGFGLIKKQNAFFPQNVEITETLSKVQKITKPNGGWGDHRDHKLCMLNTYPLNATIWNFT